MTEIEITGIRKDNGNHENPFEAVSHYQWVQYRSDGTVSKQGFHDRMAVVGWLEGKLGFEVKAYVERVQPRAYCFINVSSSGTKFLQTHPDETENNNLLQLPPV